MKVVMGVRLYTLEECGELLGVTMQTVSKYVVRKRLKARVIGGRKYVTEEDIKEFLLASQ